jgi:beta-glucosidase
VGCKRTDVVYSEGLRIGYKWYDSEGKKPLFPFGYGLSYTQFEYSDLDVAENRSRQGARSSVRVTFKVRNAGVREGAEIAQIYLSMPALAHEPPRRLIGWSRVLLHPGESRSIAVALDPKLMAIWSTARQSWEVPGGAYTVLVGRSSRDLPLWKSVTLPPFSLSPHGKR